MYVYVSVGVLQKPRGKGLIFCFMKGVFYFLFFSKQEGEWKKESRDNLE